MDYFLGEYIDLPPFTKFFATACTVLSLAVYLEFLTIYDIYFNPSLITRKYELWRLITPFLYLGPIGANFFLNGLFSCQFCKMLESSTYHSRPLDFGVFLVYGWLSVLIFAYFTSTMYLNDAFTFMIICVWARTNPTMPVDLGFTIIPVTNILLIIVSLSLLFSSNWDKLIGFATGHIYYYFEFVHPHKFGGFKLFQPWIWGPKIMNYIFYRRRYIASKQLKSEEFKEINSTSNTTTVAASEFEDSSDNSNTVDHDSLCISN